MRRLLLAILLLTGCGAEPPHHTLSWDSNNEPDMREYRVHTTHNGLFAIAHHVPDQPRQWVEIPDEPTCYFVEAVDTTGNVSEPSEIACLR